MTNEKAIECIKDLKDSFGIYKNDKDIQELFEALDMAIKALEATDQISTMYHGVEMMPKGVFEQIYNDDDVGYDQGWADGYAYGIGGEDEP